MHQHSSKSVCISTRPHPALVCILHTCTLGILRTENAIYRGTPCVFVTQTKTSPRPPATRVTQTKTRHVLHKQRQALCLGASAAHLLLLCFLALVVLLLTPLLTYPLLLLISPLPPALVLLICPSSLSPLISSLSYARFEGGVREVLERLFSFCMQLRGRGRACDSLPVLCCLPVLCT